MCEGNEQTLVLVCIACVLWLLDRKLENDLGIVLHRNCVGLFGYHELVLALSRLGRRGEFA